jgi:hypothetical protein
MAKTNFNSFFEKLRKRIKKRKLQKPIGEDDSYFHIFEKDEESNEFLYEDTNLSIARMRANRRRKHLKKVRKSLML